MAEATPGLRVDKWLWHARFFKTRGLAAKMAEKGFRLNGERSQKAHALVRPGDVLTFRQARAVRVIRVRALGVRRGPAPEAALLYEDLDPPAAAPRE
ncbi:RNA-binding S4 domain-containing protein [Pikeienuella sp. HZG-20]|uniref:RNA-binding S4 domain-containing protein n=1 Tax=Paludibacillus litoralis TaxID=3133267 RepID=UPI0030EF9576